MAERFGRGKSNGSPKFQDIDRLENSHGIVCVISQRKSSGVLTFGIWREYEVDQQTERTQFVPDYMADAYMDMVRQALERMAFFKANPDKLPFALPVGGARQLAE